MTKQSAQQKIKISQFDHGGARIYFEDEDGRHDLIVDCYQDKEFAEWILDCVKSYFEIESQQLKQE